MPVRSTRAFDGRGHPKDLDPTWMGDSIARWEGDTLVVDTVGFNDKTWLNGQGLPYSDARHVIERYRRPDLGHLEEEITLEELESLHGSPHLQTHHDADAQMGDS